MGKKKRKDIYNRADIGEFFIKTTSSSKIIFKDMIKWAKNHLTLLYLETSSHATVPLKGVWHKIFDFSFSHESFSLAGEYPSGSIKALENCDFIACAVWSLHVVPNVFELIGNTNLYACRIQKNNFHNLSYLGIYSWKFRCIIYCMKLSKVPFVFLI